jgi:hypothetical protein
MRVICLQNFSLFIADKKVKFEQVKVVKALGGVCLISNPLVIKLRRMGSYICAFMGNEFIGCASGLPEFVMKMLDHHKRADLREDAVESTRRYVCRRSSKTA